MAKRRIAQMKYFHGDAELTDVRNYTLEEIERSRLQAKGLSTSHIRNPLVGERKLAGKLPRLPGEKMEWKHLELLTADRTVRYLAKPDAHVCDWRCEGGKPGGDCWCQCQGRNHGRKFVCSEISA